ncbi:MAG: tRNA epoxyqueuosine(34) reductase QueG [Alphaproteobacteria bacterium]|nr:tRNA epoxyqueuosine(34) reductase QueG [Alphaproteobacteria bacterium]
MSIDLSSFDLDDLATKHGFAVLGIASAEADPDPDPDLAVRLDAFLAAGRHGDMQWMKDTRDRRVSPVAMWPDARSALVLGMNYAPDHDPMENLHAQSHGNISVYARGRDYHDVIKGKLKQMASQLAKIAGVEVKVFVDTAPLMEKPLAAQSGLGWQGKHTNLVSRDYGSWLFLGVILTNAVLPPNRKSEDSRGEDHCGSCTRCLDICPTNAFPAPYQLDARRCISYLTIEYDGIIPVEYRKPMGNRIFGCDDCLAVCPWNRFAKEASEQKLMARAELTMPSLAGLLNLDDTAFRIQFSASPVKRTGYKRFMRNVLIASGNSDDANLIPAILSHVINQEPVIRASAIWALSQLMPHADFLAYAELQMKSEDNQDVLAEWDTGISICMKPAVSI